FLPGFDDLLDSLPERFGNIPSGIMTFHLGQITVVADMVADPVLVHISVDLLFAGKLLGQVECLQNGTGIIFASSKIIDLAAAWSFVKGMDKTCHILRMDIVPHLLSFIAKDRVVAFFQIALHQIAEEAVEFHSGVVRTGEACPSQAAGRHAEIAAVLLYHDVARHFGGAEKGVFGLVYGKALRNPVCECRIIVFPAGFQFLQRDGVGAIAVNLVGGEVYEWRLRTGLSGGLEKVHGADGIGIEVVERDGGRPVMGRLGGRMDNAGRPQLPDELQYPLTVPYVHFVVTEVGQTFHKSLLTPAGASLGAEEKLPLVIVDPMHSKAA